MIMKYILILLIAFFAVEPLTAKTRDCEKSYFSITVKNVTGEKIVIKGKGSCTIENIKHQIFGKIGIYPEKQILVFRGRQLENEKKVKDYDIKQGMTLDLIEYEVLAKK